MLELNDPIKNINGIGDKTAQNLKRLELNKIKDFLFIFPKAYLNLNSLKPISKIIPEKKQLIRGQIKKLKLIRVYRRRMTILQGEITDKSGSLIFYYFNQPYLESILKNQKLYFFGKVRFKQGKLVMENPSYEFSESKLLKEQNLLPIYPEVAGLTSKKIRFLIKKTLAEVKEFENVFNSKIRKEFNLLNLKKVLCSIHFPKNLEQIKIAKRTWAIMEITSYLWQNEQILKKQNRFSAQKIQKQDLKKYTKNLPFKLTKDQIEATNRIKREINKDKPSSILLNGDVGSGKTVVAFILMMQTVLSDNQAAIMAPTEILARQHFLNFQKLFKEFLIKNKLKALLLTNFWQETNDGKKIKKLKKKEGTEMALSTPLVFGTHALLQEKVNFKNLNLIIIDEQQRFGVKQRAILRKKGKTGKQLPHLLMLTATPIPRTLSLTALSNFKVVFLRSHPKKRQVETKIVLERSRNQINEIIKKELEIGHQVFVICPLIEKKEEKIDFDNRKAAEAEFEKVKKTFPDFKVGLLHGKMKPRDKEKAMADFKAQKTQILVATSVVEVGVDIPKATILVVETAQMFGLSQLHQFRGRIGRSGLKAHCFFVVNSYNAKNKLKILEQSDNGFLIAKEDLRQRGPGAVLGKAQHGFLQFRFADIFNEKLVKTAKKISKRGKEINFYI